MDTHEEFDTIVGESVELTGSIANTGSILINGTVHGDVKSEQSIVVGQNAHVEGPISATTVQVSGRVTGAISASDTLELLPESRVDGDISASVLNIQPGAIFNGSSKMAGMDESGSDSVKKYVAQAKATSAAADEDEAEDDEDDDDMFSDTPKRRKPKMELEG